MQNRFMGAAALGLLIVLASGCFFATSSTTVKGVVKRYEGPVEGAVVSFGPTGGTVSMVTGKDGRFELTVKHRPTAMLYVTATKDGLAQREKQEFPGFAAPSEEIEIEMLQVFTPTR